MASNSRPIWLHGASVGDARALLGLAKGLRARHHDLLWSFQTASGRRVARSLMPELPLCRPPLDLPPLPGRALQRHQPRMLVLEYLELWPAWVAACARAGVPVVVVDGRVSHRSLRVRPLLRRAAGRLSLFCARSARDAENAERLGVPAERILVTGNGKHDSAIAAPPPSAELRALGDFDVVLGSLHGDELDALPRLAASGLRALIAPRYMRLLRPIRREAARLGVEVGLRSRGEGGRWVLLDTFGELAAAYALGRVAIVGGSFGRREGQTLVEPAAQGLPVVHGPRIDNILEEVEALGGRGATQVGDWAAAFEVARGLLEGPRVDPRPALESLRGATQRNLSALGGFLS